MEAETGLLVAEAASEFSVDELIQNLGQVIEATKGAALHACQLLLIHESLSTHTLDMAALSRIVGAIAAWSEIYPGRDVRTAFVPLGGSGQHLTIEMWKALTELNNAAVGTEVRLFADEGAARAWLMEKQTQLRRSCAV